MHDDGTVATVRADMAELIKRCYNIGDSGSSASWLLTPPAPQKTSLDSTVKGGFLLFANAGCSLFFRDDYAAEERLGFALRSTDSLSAANVCIVYTFALQVVEHGVEAALAEVLVVVSVTIR